MNLSRVHALLVWFGLIAVFATAPPKTRAEPEGKTHAPLPGPAS